MQITYPERKKDLILKNLNFTRMLQETKSHIEKGATKITISTMAMKQNKLKKNHRRNDIAKQTRKRNR